MNRRLAAMLAASSVGALAVATPGLAGPEYRNKYDSPGGTRDCGDGNTVDYEGPLKMWPPNHKLQNVAVSATDGDGGEVTLTVTPEVTDVAGGDGGPNHDPDYIAGPGGFSDTGSPTARVPFQLRAERSGRGDGRTYTINWLATFDEDACSSDDPDQSPFVVFVPHDMRGGADWKK